MDSPLVSVVIPAYNSARLIRQTLNSVLIQDYPKLEVIVVDDGSTDDTAGVAATFAGVRCITQANGGPGAARNAGIRAAHGEYVALVDADDLWLPGKLRLQMELLARTGLAWAYCDGYVFDGTTGRDQTMFSRNNHLYQGDILRPLFLNDFIAMPTPVIRRSVFEEIGYFDESDALRLREDWDWLLRAAARYPIGLVCQPLARYRAHPMSHTVREHPMTRFASQMLVIDRALAREPERLGPLKNQAISNECIGIGRSLARWGDLPEARRLFAQAIRLTPGNLAVYAYWLSVRVGGPLLSGGMRARRWLRTLHGTHQGN